MCLNMFLQTASLFLNTGKLHIRKYRSANHTDPIVKKKQTEELNPKNLIKAAKLPKKRKKKIFSKQPYLDAPVQTHMNSAPKDSVTGWPCFGLCYQRGQRQ